MTDHFLTPEEVLESRVQLRNTQAKAELVPRGDARALADLDRLAARRARARKFLDDEDEYRRLKDHFLSLLDEVPALAYIKNGEQRFATARRSSKIVVDVELLEKIMLELDYSQADVDKVIPRKHDAAALRRLVSSRRGEPLRSRLHEFASEVPHISYVTFSDPVGDDEEGDDDVT